MSSSEIVFSMKSGVLMIHPAGLEGEGFDAAEMMHNFVKHFEEIHGFSTESLDQSEFNTCWFEYVKQYCWGYNAEKRYDAWKKGGSPRKPSCENVFYRVPRA